MPEPSRIIENLTYASNCCKSVADKIKHCEKLLDKLHNCHHDEADVAAITSLNAKLDSLKDEQTLARAKRIDARKAVNELFASMRG